MAPALLAHTGQRARAAHTHTYTHMEVNAASCVTGCCLRPRRGERVLPPSAVRQGKRAESRCGRDIAREDMAILEALGAGQAAAGVQEQRQAMVLFQTVVGGGGNRTQVDQYGDRRRRSPRGRPGVPGRPGTAQRPAGVTLVPWQMPAVGPSTPGYPPGRDASQHGSAAQPRRVWWVASARSPWPPR